MQWPCYLCLFKCLFLVLKLPFSWCSFILTFIYSEQLHWDLSQEHADHTQLHTGAAGIKALAQGHHSGVDNRGTGCVSFVPTRLGLLSPRQNSPMGTIKYIVSHENQTRTVPVCAGGVHEKTCAPSSAVLKQWWVAVRTTNDKHKVYVECNLPSVLPRSLITFFNYKRIKHQSHLTLRFPGSCRCFELRQSHFHWLFLCCVLDCRVVSYRSPTSVEQQLSLITTAADRFDKVLNEPLSAGRIYLSHDFISLFKLECNSKGWITIACSPSVQ